VVTRRRVTAEEWWPLLRDVAAFCLGGAILVTQAMSEHPDPVIVGAGVALVGVTGSGRIQEWVRRRNGTGEEE
jgi:hypothetical protein